MLYYQKQNFYLMPININRSFINNTGLNESNCLNSLLDNEFEFENECDMISHSKYCTDADFICIVNLNCLNLKTMFD